MKTNIFIPQKINVGFQNRSDTYTGKLAYIIYFDEKGKLRKETSWNSWRDKNIPNEIFDNEPTEGFVLNKKAGGVEESWGHNARRTYTRVYDPRGFEFEITIPNLLWILENCDCIKGKGLEGEFVYGWDGKDLVLIPVESTDYKEIQERNKIIHNNEFIKAKELIVGATYETLSGCKYVYMGKYDYYEKVVNYYYDRSDLRYHPDRKEGWQFPLDSTWYDDVIFGYEDRRYKQVNKGKAFWFMRLGNPQATYSWDRQNDICYFKSVNRKFSNIITTECDKYIEYYDEMQKDYRFSPIDYSKNKLIPVEFEDFKKALTEHIMINKGSFDVYHEENGRLIQKIIYRHYGEGNKYYYEEKIPTSKSWYTWDKKYNKVFIDINDIEKAYNEIKPMYGEQYLENGILYSRRGYYGTEK